MPFRGKIPADHQNMRTEFAWMHTLQSDHFNIHDYEQVKDYDAVFIIFPKATVKLNAVGLEMTTPGQDRDITIYAKPIMTTLKQNNKKVCVVQEGPTWFFNEYEVVNQFNFYNQLAEADVIFAHNQSDVHFYKGLFPQTCVDVMPSLMILNKATIPEAWHKEEKAIISGNFCRWYGGFQSYIVACEFEVPIFVPASHCKRRGEEAVPELKHLPWVMWTQWMQQLAPFKYAVNLMPTVAAGTFSMNCAVFGIPCIGNEKMDTQAQLHPELSVDIGDLHQARHLAIQLRRDREFYEHCSYYCRNQLFQTKHADTKKWLTWIEDTIFHGGHDLYD